MRHFFRLMLTSSFLAIAALPGLAAEFNDAQKAEMETIIRDYLMKNPEILRDMSLLLQEKEKIAEEEKGRKGLTENAEVVFRDGDDVVVGNPKGTVTMVEFFDYNCSWCKKSVVEVTQLIEKDKELRVVLKEFPIFGEDSEYAAKAALASNRQGKYWPFHLAMFTHEGKVTKDVVDELAAAQGIDVAKLKTDMEDPAIAATIEKTQSLARAMSIGGTPAFIVDDQLIPGYLPLDGLEAAIAEVRSTGGCKLC